MISIWEKETFFAPQDVIIAGSGFAGLWSAYYLKKKNPKLKITILERGLIPTGASTRNAGFACFGSLSELVYDIQTMGIDKTLQLVEMRFKGLEKIQKFFKNNAIDFDLCGGYELFSNNDGYAKKILLKDIDYLNSVIKSITGSKHTYQLVDGKIKDFQFTNTQHMVKNNFEGFLNSGKLVQALLHKVQALGVQVFNSISIKGFEKNGSRLSLSTDQNINFTTEQLLICTSAFAKELLPDAFMTPARGQVLLTSAIKNLPWQGTFHYDEGYYYFRNLGNRVLLGGARNKAFEAENTTEIQTSEAIQTELERFLAEVILPQHHGQYIIENRWAGIMGMGKEKMPVVEEVQPNIFCAIGTGGMGVALAPVMGKQVSKLIA